MENPNLDNIVLSLLFASDEPLSARKIAAVVEDVTAADVRKAVETWNQRADAEAWSIGIEQIAGGYRLATRPEYSQYVSRLYAGRRRFRLSRAALETLAIIAYKQPVTRAEIESIRGVGCGSVVANLLERTLVQIVGKARVLGAPFLYGTTQEFLEYLGLNSLKDLPSMEDLETLLAREAVGEVAVEDDRLAAHRAARGDEADETVEAEAELRAAIAGGVDSGEPDAGDEIEMARSSSARIGPRVDEPVNRPLYNQIVGGVKDAVPVGPSPPRPAVADDDADEEADDKRE